MATSETTRRYLDKLKREGKCTRCQKPMDPERIGKCHCRACVIEIVKAQNKRRDALKREGVCTWCKDPMEPHRVGKDLCIPCTRMRVDKGRGDSELRIKSCDRCGEPGHTTPTCKEQVAP